MEISLFRNLEKHTAVDALKWIPDTPQPVTVPINQELKQQVLNLHQQVSELATNVRTMRRDVVSQVSVISMTEQLGADTSIYHDMSEEEEDDTNNDNTTNTNNNKRKKSNIQTEPDLVTRDMLKRLKTNVDTLVSTTESLRRDVPQCLAVSQRELRAATQVLQDSSNVDQAMARSTGKTSTLTNASSSSSSSSTHHELGSTPRGAIRGLLASEHAVGYGNTKSFEE
tara:strand:+ start:91 stop:768 length:678 start_codon:yes stop_codon:yes gene_type:complete